MQNARRILLLGGYGQVGWELQRSLAPLGEVWAPELHSTNLCGDLLNTDAMRRAIRELQPHIIVNAAAHTLVDQAESEYDLAWNVNARAPGMLAEEADRLNAWMVHYSTDYVFDGSGTDPWTENDTPAPLNAYGRTKLGGEELVRAACRRHLILRTSWVYATRGQNFAKTILQLACERDRLKVVDDQVGSPTGADLLADVTAHTLRQAIADETLSGLYHVTAQGHVSWHAFAHFVIEHARAAGMPVKVAPGNIEAVPSSAYAVAARRPLNSRMDCALVQRTFSLSLPPWQNGVARMVAEVTEPR